MRKLDEFHFRQLITCSPSETAYEASLKMEDNRVGCILVLRSGKIVGIATRYDFIHHIIVNGLDPRKTSISKIMHTSPVRIESSLTMMDALKLMAKKKVERLVVIKSPEVILGVISLEDVISSLESSEVFHYMSAERAEQIRGMVKRLTPHLLARYSGEERTQLERDLTDETKALVMLLEESEVSLRA